MITKIQPVDPEMLGKQYGSNSDAGITVRAGNRIRPRVDWGGLEMGAGVGGWGGQGYGVERECVCKEVPGIVGLSAFYCYRTLDRRESGPLTLMSAFGTLFPVGLPFPTSIQSFLGHLIVSSCLVVTS